MKNKIIILTLLALIAASCNSGKQPKAPEGQILETNPQMTITLEADAEIVIAGSGSVTIDWDDESPAETHELKPYNKDAEFATQWLYSRKYPTNALRTITITGGGVTYLQLSNLGLTRFDVSRNEQLEILYCSGNSFLTNTNLEMSKNKQLTELWCSYNNLTALDLSQNEKLVWLECSNNELTSVELSKNARFRYLNFDNNKLSASALNAIFYSLHGGDVEGTGSKTIYIRNNPGSAHCQPDIARNKGWEVVGIPGTLSSIREIDSMEYFSAKEKINIPEINREKITDLKRAKKMLKGRVVWGEGDWSNAVYNIVFRSGKTFPRDDYSEMLFVAYYPQEEILLLEGGHSSDVSFNLNTGEKTENTGNPDYIVFSPSQKYRLNGYHSGHEWVYYFIQEKTDGQYQRIINLDDEFEVVTGFRINFILDAYWENDTTLNIVRNQYATDGFEKSYYYQINIGE